jgi:serine/threonine-protein kinase
VAASVLVGALAALAIVLAVPRRVPQEPREERREAAVQPAPAGEPQGMRVEAPASTTVVDEPEPAPEAAPPPGRGRIDVNARPWARVYLDGKEVGYTPLVLRRIPAGKHVLRLVNPELEEERKIRVKVEAGAVRKIAVDFTADPSLY